MDRLRTLERCRERKERLKKEQETIKKQISVKYAPVVKAKFKVLEEKINEERPWRRKRITLKTMAEACRVATMMSQNERFIKTMAAAAQIFDEAWKRPGKTELATYRPIRIRRE